MNVFGSEEKWELIQRGLLHGEVVNGGQGIDVDLEEGEQQFYYNTNTIYSLIIYNIQYSRHSNVWGKGSLDPLNFTLDVVHQRVDIYYLKLNYIGAVGGRHKLMPEIILLKCGFKLSIWYS